MPPRASVGGQPRRPVTEIGISGPGLAFGRSTQRAAAKGDEFSERGQEPSSDGRSEGWREDEVAEGSRST